MDLRQKIGQMFMIGFTGTEPGCIAEELITEMHLGGVILFRPNCQSTEQLKTLLKSLQDCTASNGRTDRLLVSIDQEGGPWIILGAHICPAFPTNWEHGQSFRHTGDVEPVRRQAKATAKVHRDLGINMNLAPVVDVVTHSGNEVISTRAFGDNTETVSKLGAEYINVLQDAGVIATAKHFPGHGPTDIDSHKALPTVHMERSEIDGVHLPPFIAAIKAGTDAVMTAHMVYSSVSDTPATLCKTWLTDELRGNLGFEGVIITDDMNMLAIADNFTRAEAAVAAVNAGVDIVLVCANPEIQREMYAAVLSAAESGAISAARIDESVGRILAMKKKYGLLDS